MNEFKENVHYSTKELFTNYLHWNNKLEQSIYEAKYGNVAESWYQERQIIREQLYKYHKAQ